MHVLINLKNSLMRLRVFFISIVYLVMAYGIAYAMPQSTAATECVIALELFSENTECAICLNSVTIDNAYILNCPSTQEYNRHIFHGECIKSWWTVKNLHCPVCQSNNVEVHTRFINGQVSPLNFFERHYIKLQTEARRSIAITLTAGVCFCTLAWYYYSGQFPDAAEGSMPLNHLLCLSDHCLELDGI